MRLKQFAKRKGIKELVRDGAKSMSSNRVDRLFFNKRFFNVKEVAAYLNMAEKTVRNKLSLKTFPIRELHRGGTVLFEVSDVVRYANSLR